MQFTTNNEVGSPAMDKIVNWANQGKGECIAWHNGTDIYVKTQDGQSRAIVGDWIVKSSSGVFYSCTPDVFNKTYELADNKEDKNGYKQEIRTSMFEER